MTIFLFLLYFKYKKYLINNKKFKNRCLTPSSSPFSVSAGRGEAGGPSRADVQALPGGGQERQWGSVIRGLPVSHAQGDPPASQLGPQTTSLTTDKAPPPHRSPPACKRNASPFFKKLIN